MGLGLDYDKDGIGYMGLVGLMALGLGIVCSGTPFAGVDWVVNTLRKEL